MSPLMGVVVVVVVLGYGGGCGVVVVDHSGKWVSLMSHGGSCSGESDLLVQCYGGK